MIQISESILDKVNENEMYFLLILAKYMNSENQCFETLDFYKRKTGWSVDKIRKYTAQLESKNIITKARQKDAKGKYSTIAFTVITEDVKNDKF